MADELHQIIDECAEKLGRSIILDSLELRTMASSRHYGDEDETRLQTFLAAGTSTEATEYLRAQGATTCDVPRWIAGRKDLGLAGRLYVPVRCNGRPFGMLCLIDRDRSLEATHLPELVRVADQIGVLLYAQELRREREKNQEEAVLRELVSSDARARQDAAREIVEEGLLDQTGRFIVVTMHWMFTEEERTAQLRHKFTRVLSRGRARSVIAMSTRQRLTLLIGGATETSKSHDLHVDVASLCTQLVRESPRTDLVCGISGVLQSLDDAREGFTQARLAAHAAEKLAGFDRCASWPDLGVFATLLQLPATELAGHAAIPVLERLRRVDESGDLLRTAEVFLDCAGDTRRAAEALHIHRSTLYYRLSKIEQATELSLDDGSVRLVLHLALKARQLSR